MRPLKWILCNEWVIRCYVLVEFPEKHLQRRSQLVDSITWPFWWFRWSESRFENSWVNDALSTLNSLKAAIAKSLNASGLASVFDLLVCCTVTGACTWPITTISFLNTSYLLLLPLPIIISDDLWKRLDDIFFGDSFCFRNGFFAESFGWNSLLLKSSSKRFVWNDRADRFFTLFRDSLEKSKPLNPWTSCKLIFCFGDRRKVRKRKWKWSEAYLHRTISWSAGRDPSRTSPDFH